MHSTIILEYFDWKPRQLSRKARLLNSLFERLGMTVRLDLPQKTGWMTNAEQRLNMYHLSSQVLVYRVEGDFVELGCHAGQSACLFQMIIDHFDPSRDLHVYDSFEGLPGVNEKDGMVPFMDGELSVGEQALINNFNRLNLKPPTIQKGWFQDTIHTLPEKIAFAHLDGDLYESTLTSLEGVYPRLTRGAVCLIDDYSDPAVHQGFDKWQGVKKACDEFLADKPEKVSVLYAGEYAHGFFRKI